MSAIHWDSFFFLFFALVTCVFAVAVVVSNNIVRMAAYLVGSLCGVAGLFFLSGAQFLGAMQLMLYVGGTVVLLVFGVMLTARGPFVSMQSGGGQWILALLGGRIAAGRAAADRAPGRADENQRRLPWRPPRPIPRRPSWAPAWSASAPTRSVDHASDGKNRTRTSATSCRLKSSRCISWSSSWGPPSCAGQARVGAREQGMELSDERLGGGEDEG